MSLQTRLSALISAIGADIKSLTDQVSEFGSGAITTTIDGGATPTTPYDGSVLVNGGVGIHVGPTPPSNTAMVWVNTS